MKVPCHRCGKHNKMWKQINVCIECGKKITNEAIKEIKQQK